MLRQSLEAPRSRLLSSGPFSEFPVSLLSSLSAACGRVIGNVALTLPATLQAGIISVLNEGTRRPGIHTPEPPTCPQAIAKKDFHRPLVKIRGAHCLPSTQALLGVSTVWLFLVQGPQCSLLCGAWWSLCPLLHSTPPLLWAQRGSVEALVSWLQWTS